MDAPTRIAVLRIASSSSSGSHLFLSTNRTSRNLLCLHSSERSSAFACPRLLPSSQLINSGGVGSVHSGRNNADEFAVPTTNKCCTNSHLLIVCPRNFINRHRCFGNSSLASCSSLPFPISNRAPFLSNSIILHSWQLGRATNSSESGIDKRYHVWHREFEIKRSDRPLDLAVVLLGWLGAERKHLKRYAEWYASRGIQPITFVVPLKDLLGFDIGERIEQRLSMLADELVAWLTERAEDGKERGLLVHTFSNTGWFSYGVILENLQSKGNLTEKIKGCVVDSGPEPELNPVVWASGFSAAMLKKRNSLTSMPKYGSEDTSVQDAAKLQESGTSIAEIVLLAALEKFFSVFLKLPAVKEKLDRIISTLSHNQPACPQLYLYSGGDRVVPWQSIERFMAMQKATGRTVMSHDFKTSPHVDHFRTFPAIYAAQLQGFLDECIPVRRK
ncbi:uncharacterized protein LOC116247237 [Nymphaea colorata]|nr:uncharacterized protein LOC116247237 [Nymphaea colorata]